MLKEAVNFAVVFGCLIIVTARSETSCTNPEPPENGSVQVSDEPKIGTLAYYSCDVDATLVGESILICLLSGKWSIDAPKCLRSCYVSEIEDGQLGKYEWKNQFTRRDFIKFQVGKSIKHHEKVTILCKDEYIPGNQEMGKSQEVECNDGSWTEPLYCRPKISCEMPDASKYGSVQLSDKLKIGTLAFFSCDEGATLVGVPTTKCLPSGKWSFDPPTCLVSCQNSPPVVENAEVVAVNAKHGGKVTYQCDENFNKFRNETIVCDFGIWKGDPPLCKKMFCLSSPPSFENAHVVTVISKHKGRVTYKCNEDFEKIENETVVCDFGIWKGNPPVCKKRELLLIHSFPAHCNTTGIQNGELGRYERTLRYRREFVPLSPNYKVMENETLYLRCYGKYLVSGSEKREERVSCKHGKWSRKLRCEPVSCDINPPSGENARVVSINRRHGGRVTYQCEENFEKIENETVVCFFRVWRGRTPLCKNKNCTVPVLHPGDMRQEKIGDNFWSWKTLRYDRNQSYVKVPAGSVMANNMTLTLFCPTQYIVQGTNLKIKAITCIDGLWKPDPVCIRDL